MFNNKSSHQFLILIVCNNWKWKPLQFYALFKKVHSITITRLIYITVKINSLAKTSWNWKKILVYLLMYNTIGIIVIAREGLRMDIIIIIRLMCICLHQTVQYNLSPTAMSALPFCLLYSLELKLRKRWRHYTGAIIWWPQSTAVDTWMFRDFGPPFYGEQHKKWRDGTKLKNV